LANAKVVRVRDSSFSIYENLSSHPGLYFDTQELEMVLNNAMGGLNLDYPIRTRSKVVKSAICAALGYSIPPSFKKTQPRFPGQNFDTYTQKADNLQVWNEEVSPSRRYVLIRVDASSRVTRVRVVTGEVIAALDPTGTLTHKFQAKFIGSVGASTLVSSRDTSRVVAASAARNHAGSAIADQPLAQLLSIADLYKRLLTLVGKRFRNPGLTQERNRGALLHQMVQAALGDVACHDNGQFPDVPHQLLELKLQTASTVDLGLVSPDSTEPFALIPFLRHCDVRYGLFYGKLDSGDVVLDHVVLVTGEDFFKVFRRFEGKVKNSKLQIPLPRGFFGDAE